MKSKEITDGEGTHLITEIHSRPSLGGEFVVTGDAQRDFRDDWELVSQTPTEAVFRGGEFARDDRKVETLSDPYDPALELGALIEAVSGRMHDKSIPIGVPVFESYYEYPTGRIVVSAPDDPFDQTARLMTAAADIFEVCGCDAYNVRFVGGGIAVVWQAAHVWMRPPWYFRTYGALTRWAADGVTQVRNHCCRSRDSGFPQHTFCGDIQPECEARSVNHFIGLQQPMELFPGEVNGTGYQAVTTPPCNLAP